MSITSWRIPLTLCIGLCIGLSSTVLHGQTLFQRPDTIPVVSRYRSVEECLTAVARVSDSAKFARQEFPDTMPFKKGEGRDSVAAPVIETARQCSAKSHPDSVILTGAVETYTNWMQLYLTANRDDAAVVTAQRRIMMARQQQSQSPRALYRVLMAVMEMYGDIRPMRWDKVQETGAQLEAPGVAPGPLDLYDVYAAQYQFAETVGDTIVQTDMAKRMLALAETMSPEIRKTQRYVGVRYMNFTALTFLTRTDRMDSLRRGPEAYVALTRANWQTAFENFTIPVSMHVGEKASPVTGEFWFASSNTALTTQPDHPRPSPGKISLVVFLRQGCNEKTPVITGGRGLTRATMRNMKRCLDIYASLRRLGQRFPWLETTLVSRTAGYSGDTGPMSPQDEALVLQKWWLGFHRLPATLAVANTEFFRLEGPDRRRVDQPVSNDVNYLFEWLAYGNEVWSGMAYLVDTNGMIIHSSELIPANEWMFDEMLSVIGRRGK